MPAFQLLRLYSSGQSISVLPLLQTPTSVNSLLLIRHLTPGRQRAASLSSFPVWLCILGVASDFSHKYSKVTLILSLVIKSKVFPCVNFIFFICFCFLLDLCAVIGCGGALLTVWKTSVCDDIYNEALR